MTDLFEAESSTTTSLDLRRMQREERKKRRRMRVLMASAVGLVIFALGASIAYNFLQAFKSDQPSIDDYPGPGQGAVVVIVNPGEAGDVIAATLFQNGVIASERSFILAWGANQDAAQSISPGYYRMQREMRAEDALFALLERERRQETTITIPEGFRVEAILDRIASVTEYSLEDVEAAAADVEGLNLPEEAGGNLEGWLFPATYRFNPGVHPTDVLAEMVRTTVVTLEGIGVPRTEWQETLILASLVEKEAKLEDDRAMIAGVIQNRLDAGRALELDSTVHYYAPGDSVFTSDEDRQSNNPYNTYRVVGLPPGPIASPGRASIEAAVAPEQHNFYYFVTINLLTGETAYGETFAQHLRNVEILRAWQAENTDDS